MQRRHWYAVGLVTCVALAFFVSRRQSTIVAAPNEAGKAAGGIVRCGTPEITDKKTLAAIRKVIAANPQGRDNAAGPLVIPVQFIHITDGAQGQVTAQQRTDQLDVLNDAYSAWGIQFVSNGAAKVHNDATWFDMPVDSATELAAKSALQEDPNTVLNFYTCNADNGNLIGWATFPWSLSGNPELDGVVCHWQTLPGGTFDPFNLGQTATHEIGHWIGLHHTFQGGCNGAGDEVSDTIAHASPNFGCPSPGQNGACNAAQQAPIHNFMNYTDDDCMTEFTAGQAARWQSMLSTYRPDLGTSEPPPCECPLDCMARIPGLNLLPLESLPQLRALRDNLLDNSADGRRLARLYYDHGPEVFRIMTQDPELAQRSVRAILTALPKDLGASGRVAMPAELYDECLVLLERLQLKSGEDLTIALDDVRAVLERRAKVVNDVVILSFPADRRQVARVTTTTAP